MAARVCGNCAWIAFYNGRRPHQALGNRTLMTIRREGVTGLLADNAVDMTLRLDNADALTTCPQRQQQQQTTCAALSRRGAGSVSNQERPSSGPADGGHFTGPPSYLEP
jgi:hypothetical protein